MPAINHHLYPSISPSAPATRGEAVTPHDVNELARVSRALYVGGAGDLKVTMAEGDELTFSAVPAGSVLPLRVKKVFSTGTTATLIVAVD